MYTTETLNLMKLPELQRLFAETTGTPTRSPNKVWIVKRILYAQPAMPAPTLVEAEKPAQATKTPKPGPAARREPKPPRPRLLVAQAEETPIETPTPPKEKLADRLTAIRNAASIEALDALLNGPGKVQAAARTEAVKQRDSLDRVLALRDTDGETAALRARLANQQSVTRPGVAVLIRGRLAELGVAVDTPAGEDKPLPKMTVEELRARYSEVVGRSTSSDHRGYLIWKIREGLKGRITVGAVTRTARKSGVEVKVLPLRMEGPVVEAIDAAWKRLGYKSRMGFIREAITARLQSKGEVEAAELVRVSG